MTFLDIPSFIPINNFSLYSGNPIFQYGLHFVGVSGYICYWWIHFLF